MWKRNTKNEFYVTVSEKRILHACVRPPGPHLPPGGRQAAAGRGGGSTSRSAGPPTAQHHPRPPGRLDFHGPPQARLSKCKPLKAPSGRGGPGLRPGRFRLPTTSSPPLLLFSRQRPRRAPGREVPPRAPPQGADRPPHPQPGPAPQPAPSPKPAAPPHAGLPRPPAAAADLPTAAPLPAAEHRRPGCRSPSALPGGGEQKAPRPRPPLPLLSAGSAGRRNRRPAAANPRPSERRQVSAPPGEGGGGGGCGGESGGDGADGGAAAKQAAPGRAGRGEARLQQRKGGAVWSCPRPAGPAPAAGGAAAPGPAFLPPRLPFPPLPSPGGRFPLPDGPRRLGRARPRPPSGLSVALPRRHRRPPSSPPPPRRPGLLVVPPLPGPACSRRACRRPRPRLASPQAAVGTEAGRSPPGALSRLSPRVPAKSVPLGMRRRGKLAETGSAKK